VQATGLGEGDIWDISAAFVVGFVAAAPALNESDARIGLWVRRRREREEALIEGAEHEPAPEPVPLSDEIAGDTVTIPIDRGTSIRWGVGCFLGAAAALLIALLAADVSVVEQVILLASAPFVAYAGYRTLLFLRRPYFLRIAPGGADLLGAGEIPWDAIASADVVSHSRARWLALSLTEPLTDQAWATDEIRKLAKRSGGEDVEALLRFCDWPAERVAVAVRRTGRVGVEAYLA
jgi:hypothetical protein